MTRRLMRAAVVAAPGRAEIENVSLPDPKQGEVRVRVEGCGVCASSLELWGGQPWFEYPQPPGAPGHEGWGEIDAVGEGVEDLSVGQRVAMLSSRAFAEFDVARADSVVPLPRQFEGQPFPAEPLGCAMNIFRRSDVRAGQWVAVVGVGFLGALLVRLSKLAGARVVAVTRRPFALEVAREFGADKCVAMDDHWRIIEQVKELTRGEGCERVIECVGKQWPLDLAAELTRERGRLIIAGYHQDGPRQVNMQLWNWRGLDVVNAHERDPAAYLEGMRDALGAVERGEIDPSPLYTHTFKLDRLGDALDAVRDRPDGFLKALVTT